jgi:hypothetical protein
MGMTGEVKKVCRWALPGAAMLCLCLAPTLCFAAAAGQGPLVLVERLVDTRYGETARANADFDRALGSPLVIARTVKKGDSMQSITSQVYGIGPGADTARYAALEARIKDLNNVDDADKLSEGSTLLLPDIPPKQYKTGSGDNPYYGQPRISSGPALEDVRSGKGFDFAKGATVALGAISDLKRKAAPLLRQWRWVPASTVKNDPTVRVIAQPITVRFSAEQGDPSADEIAQDIGTVQRFASANAGLHESVVFVLDDSWPDNEEFQASLQFFKQADARIREAFYLGAAQWPASLNASAVTSFPFDQDDRGSHARLIKEALKPFTAINSKVRVVYLPLFVEQGWAAQVLREIILVTMIARSKYDKLETNLSVATMADIVKEATKYTDEIMTQLPKYKTGRLADTDQAIITAMLKFCQLYAMATSAPFFLNASWTVEKYQIEFGPDSEPLGVVLAAAGDNEDTDIYNSSVLLASRAREYPGDVIVVGNAHADGNRGRCSAFWNPPEGANVYGLYYNGFVGRECGSSLSAPRIAWMLALRESARPAVADPATRLIWFQNYRSSILKLQNPQAAGELRYWFSPKAVLQGPH